MPIEFAQSARSTVGIEWELQLVDKDSNDLRQAADTVIAGACLSGAKHPLIHREMMLNTIELTSHPRSTVAQCGQDLREALDFLRPITERLRIDLTSSGVHPFVKPAYQRVTDSKRYAKLMERTRYWGQQMQVLGTHVHVGVEERAKVLPIISALLARGGQLQALAASSPFWSREDTGYASNRAMFFQQLPTAGVPPQFKSWSELENYTRDVLKTGVIENFDELRWDVRPSPKFGTVEVRIADASSNIREVLAIGAFIRSLVEYYSTLLDKGEQLPCLPQWFVDENKWRSARYGMDATLIVDAAGTQVPCRQSIRELLETITPIAQRLGDSQEIGYIQEILDLGAAYERQRVVAARFDGSLDAVVEFMRSEMANGGPLNPQEFTPLSQSVFSTR